MSELTINPDALAEMLAKLPPARPDVRWEFRRSRYAPPDLIYVAKLPSPLWPGMSRDVDYVVFAAVNLTYDQQLAAISMYLDKAKSEPTHD